MFVYGRKVQDYIFLQLINELWIKPLCINKKSLKTILKKFSVPLIPSNGSNVGTLLPIKPKGEISFDIQVIFLKHLVNLKCFSI